MMEENAAAVCEEAGAAAAEATVPQKKRRRINRQKLQDNLWGWAFCLPLIVGTVLFTYIALVMALLLSFTTYSATVHGDVWAFLGRMFSGETDMNGLTVFQDMDMATRTIRTNPWRWYQFIFTDAQFTSGVSEQMANRGVTEMSTMGATLFNTVFYLIGIPIGMVLSMFLAVCMSRDIKGGNFFRVLYYLPCVASTVSIIYTFSNLFSASGVINEMLNTDIPWFVMPENTNPPGYEQGIDPYWTLGMINKCVVVIMMVWKGLGGTIILYIAGLSGVNAATKEAAQIDGASGWKIFWKVTMPDLDPVIFYNVVTAVIGGMQIYAEPELFFPTSTGAAASYLSKPNLYTSGYVSLIWYWGLQPFTSPGNATIDLGITGSAPAYQSLGAAYGMVLAVIIFVLTLFQFWLDKRNNN